MSDKTPAKDAAIIERQSARAPGLSYAAPTMLHETNKKYIRFIPFTIRNSTGEQFSLKIEAGNPRTPLVRDVISFDAEDVRKLQLALAQHAPVMTGGSEGTYFLVRLADGHVPEGTDPVALLRAASTMLSTPSVIAQLAANPIVLAEATKQAVRLAELRSAIDELRALLDAGVDEETRYQSWLSQHSWIFGVEYMDADQVRAMTARDSVDSFIPRYANGYREIVELKLPSMPVLHLDTGHRNFYFSSEVSKAIGQVHRYLDKFVERGASGIDDYIEVIAYHPVATIVIGRSSEWTPDQHRALRGLNSRLHGIDIITFDYLLLRGERLLEIISPSTKS